MKKLISTLLITTMTFTVVLQAVNAMEQEPITQTQSVIMEYDVVGGHSASCIASFVGMSVAAFALMGVTGGASFAWWLAGIATNATSVGFSCSE